jgi:glutaminyl-peptide cyclotransferase
VRLTFSSLYFVLPMIAAAAGLTAVASAHTQASAKPARAAARATPEFGYKVVRTYPHDRTAFTQGLEYRAGVLYESTGLHGRSSLRKVKLETGEVLQRTELSPDYFAEGITILNAKIVQLTYKTEVGFVYDQPTFKVVRQFKYPGEGWGLTNDGTRLYMSDGSEQIRFWDPNTLQETQRLTVRDGGTVVKWLNELEFIRGEIYANIWMTNKIARISPKDGHVTGWIDLTGLLTPAEEASGVDVLNGIAYDPMGDRLFVTGKLWPKLFEIKLVPRTAGGSR